MLYGSECWSVLVQHVRKVSVAEIQMLRWMCGYIDKIRNDYIHEKVQVAYIEDKMRLGSLRWFGYVLHRPPDAPYMW